VYASFQRQTENEGGCSRFGKLVDLKLRLEKTPRVSISEPNSSSLLSSHALL